MNQHLKQAIAAARAGKEPQAKVLLARVIKDEPENVNAWFLLSSLADTEEQKVQHLEKVLELQPDHQVASQQLAELAPPPLAVVEETDPNVIEAEADVTPDMFPLPDIDLPEDNAPEDPDEAMAWLEQLAADQGAPMDELPTMIDDPETAETVFEMPDLDDTEVEDSAPDDPDEAMAWLEQLAADQGAPMDELPTLLDGEDDDEETFAWLDEVDEDASDEDTDFLDMLPTLVDESTADTTLDFEEEDTTKTMAVSDETLDFISQAEGDSIPSWLAGDEEFISADTVITGPAEEIPQEQEPENLPDWLNEMPVDDWEGEEGKKSGQVVWKAGEGDESLKPEAPAAKKESKPAAKQTAKAKDNTNIYIAGLAVIALILIFAILYLLFA